MQKMMYNEKYFRIGRRYMKMKLQWKEDKLKVHLKKSRIHVAVVFLYSEISA